LHRLGTATEASLRRIFGDLGDEYDDLHRGVFVTEFPIVAYAYAANRSEFGENEFGLADVSDPPVLIGFDLKEQEYIDTDAIVTAAELLKTVMLPEFLELDEDDTDGINDLFSDHARQDFYDLMDGSEIIKSIGGDIGNRASIFDLYRAALELQEFIVKQGGTDTNDVNELPSVIREKALKLARRLCRSLGCSRRFLSRRSPRSSWSIR
jgi:hypothetical protein